MKLSHAVIGSCALGMILIAPAANAAFSVGASAAVEMYPYKGIDTDVRPFPMINYDGDRFYVRGIGAGVYLWKDASDQVSLDAYYSPLRFRPNKSDDHQMKQLDKRRATVMGGATYRHIASWGTIRTSVSADMLDNNDGFRADGAYFYPVNLGDWKLTPGIGMSWNSSDFNDYYYGVSGHEARRSGMRQYSASSSWSPYAELTANYKLASNWNTFVSGRYTQLDNEIKDSPMVNQSYSALFVTGVNYSF
ncbi:MAG: MipA/OmpV family protein [Enterobacteriaceae bacterium]|jgi:outer membrane protein|nr:MipA/OmpV family protein [Enterobacteriaceae bacterium]